ncbi:MAG: S-layer homology domain-containing protein [bacterium]|nr:S-layer homology domain-containing protein [bacterium]
MRNTFLFSTTSTLLSAGLSVFVVILGAWGYSKVLVQAQQLLPAGVTIPCTPVIVSAKLSNCSLQVPGDTIGLDHFQLSIPRTQLTSLGALDRSSSVPLSGVFFKLDQAQTTQDFSLNIAYADLQTTALGTSPFPLLTFDLGVVSVDPSLYPLTIPAVLRQGAEFHTPDSLAQGTAAFTATSDLRINIILTLSSTGTPGAAPPTGGGDISSSFTYRGGGGGGVGGYTAPSRFCFADDPESMSFDEWDIICDAKRRGIISGNPQSDGTFLFLPNQPINRAEATKIVTLGELRSLGLITDQDFTALESSIGAVAFSGQSIKYPNILSYKDITYDPDGTVPWYAPFVLMATRYQIVHGYLGDNTFRPVNKIINAESYRIIGESAARASSPIQTVLDQTTQQTKNQDWFMKYIRQLESYQLEFSRDYEKYTTRKEFVVLMMALLNKVGL